MAREPQMDKETDMPSLPPLPISRSSHAIADTEEQHLNLAGSHDAENSNPPRLRFLSPHEWTIFAQGVGGVGDAELQSPVHAKTDGWWPSRGMPPGLYRDVVFHRAKFFYLFHMASISRWVLMILQLFIGATLTALSTKSLRHSTPITILSAANTIIAGLLALIHNSGLPDRYRHDMVEFEETEDHIREILDAGIVAADLTIDQVLAECFDLFQNAKATVQVNMPASYQSSKALHDGRQSTITVSSTRLQSSPKATVGGNRPHIPTNEK